jgi:hypothetical protein
MYEIRRDKIAGKFDLPTRLRERTNSIFICVVFFYCYYDILSIIISFIMQLRPDSDHFTR